MDHKVQRALSTRNDDTIELPLRVPRSALTVLEAPVRVTQRTSERVLGIPKRSFLDLTKAYAEAGGEVLVLGKLKSVRVDDFERWLRTRNQETPTTGATAQNDYAAELGLRLVGGSR